MLNLTRIVLSGLATLASASLLMAAAGPTLSSNSEDSDANRGVIGPDVVCWIAADGHAFYGSVDGIGGYSTGTTSCNYGDVPAAWYGGTTETPLIAQNAYRLHQGRFEQIGMSWLKHSFCALSQGGCG
ncbi:MAG: hypothetical protein P8L37_05225, partial [Phycisphaerales bacterium]|nr:hypothetical protein [Phycisphaerales bacterium]